MPADPPVPPDEQQPDAGLPALPEPPAKTEPSEDWEHYQLYLRVKDDLLTLPAYFDVETSITGISATEIHNLNTFLGATIETTVAATDDEKEVTA